MGFHPGFPLAFKSLAFLSSGWNMKGKCQRLENSQRKREVETENQKDGWKQLTRACALIGFHPFAFGSFGFLSTSPFFILGWPLHYDQPQQQNIYLCEALLGLLVVMVKLAIQDKKRNYNKNKKLDLISCAGFIFNF